MNQVYCGCGVYHIYISILKAFEDKRNGRKSLLVIINDRTDGIEDFIPKLKGLDVFEDVVSVKSYGIFDVLKKRIGLYNYIFKRAQAIQNEFEDANPHILNYHDFIQNAEINLFHIVRTRAYFLIKYPENSFRMMEEGTGTYVQTLPFLRFLKRKYFMKFPLLMGYDKQVKEVVVQFPEQMKAKILRDKAVKLDLYGLEQSLTSSDRKQIVEIFQGEQIDLYSTKKKAIILTQPLQSTGFKVDTKEMVRIYSDFVNQAQASGCDEIFFKEHPREDVSYEDFFPENPFIPKLMPIEVLNLDENIKFDWGYTICSGSIDNLKNLEQKINLGRDYLKK